MRPIPGDTQQRRALLRRRLLDLAATHDATTIEQQIDALIEDIGLADLDPLPMRSPQDSWDEDQRIVVTGMGVVTPLGIGIEPFWQNLTAGKSGIHHVESFNISTLASQIAGEVPGFDPKSYMDAKDARRISRASQFAVAAARMALEDADLTVDASNSHQIGALIGNGSSSPPDTEAAAYTLIERGLNKVNPFYITGSLPNMPSCQVSIQLGLRGYNTSIATACAASAQAIGEAAEIIRRGDATVMLAGGSEAPVCKFTLACFSAARALSTRNDDPEHASRPFDAQRDGFIVSEGAGVLVLESLAHARRRGARIYAELIGYASTSDAFHVTAPHPDGDGAARAMIRAMQKAEITPQQVDYINAHATSTAAGDLAETLAIKQAFGEYAYSVPISASKSMLGHLTSAAGAVEASAAILAMRHSLIPPTTNLFDPDPRCDLDYVPHTARRASLQVVMSNSFGFGGVNAVLIFQQPPPTI